ncbi:unnamed protein product [Arabidopsis halleri]
MFIFLASSTWCHVMEAGSFEDEEVAKILNDSFASIKVNTLLTSEEHLVISIPNTFPQEHSPRKAMFMAFGFYSLSLELEEILNKV